MRWWWIALIFLLLPPAQVEASSPPGSLSGHWIIRSYEHCVRDAQEQMRPDQIVCTTAGRALTKKSQLDAYSNQAGDFTFVEQITVASPGMTGDPHPACNLNTLSLDGPVHSEGAIFTPGAPPYTWRCRLVSRGTGFFKLGAHHHVDFWVAHETDTFIGQDGTVQFVDPRKDVPDFSLPGPAYPYDSGIPAVARSYNREQVLRLSGTKGASYPPSYQVWMSVRHLA